MSDFFFQQYASRDKYGHRWLETCFHFPHEWLESFEEALRSSNLVPSDGSKLGNQLQGGVYCPDSGDFAVVFAFQPAPADFKGRSGGIIINALFCKGHPFPQASLKKVWEHDSLRNGIETSVSVSIFITLDQDYGNTMEEQSFFSVLKNYRRGEECLKAFASAIESKTSVSVQTQSQPEQRNLKRPEHQPTTPTPSPSPKIENQQSKGPRMKLKLIACFMLGIFIGIAVEFFWRANLSGESITSEKILSEIPVALSIGHSDEFVLELKCRVKRNSEDKWTFTVVSLETRESKEPEETLAGHTKNSPTPSPSGFLNGIKNDKED